MPATGKGMLVFAAVVTAAGLALAITTPILLARDHAKAERLRGRGVPVEASVTGWGTKQRSHAAADYLALTYKYDDVQHAAHTHCGGADGCALTPATTMRIWVDPRHPDAFATDDGNTDDTAFVTNGLYLPAIFLTLCGAAGIWAATGSRVTHRRR